MTVYKYSTFLQLQLARDLRLGNGTSFFGDFLTLSAAPSVIDRQKSTQTLDLSSLKARRG